MTDDTTSSDDGIEFTHGEDPDPDPDGAADDLGPDDRAGPHGDLAEAIDGAADDGSRSETPAFDELFDRRDTAEIDGEQLWERLEDDDLPAPTASDDREVREVDKRAYCQGCEYLADPPDVACTHDDAAILAVPTIETVRVADCPFALEDDDALERDR